MNTRLTDCLTIVASHFGRVVSTGLPYEGDNRYLFCFADDRISDYVCAVKCCDDNISVEIYLDLVVMFGIDGSAGVGDIIRFGAADRSRTINVGTGHTYFGDAVIVAVASSESITIGSSANLSQIGFTTSAKFSQLPKSTVLDPQLSQKRTDVDNTVYGISTTSSTTYSATHQGWVGITTYLDTDGVLRVKNEVLVAMSGITTTKSTIGNTPSIPYPTSRTGS